MGKGKPQSSYRRRKRTFAGNRYTRQQNCDVSSGSEAENDHNIAISSDHVRAEQSSTSSAQPSASASKLKESTCDDIFDPNESLSGFRFIDCELLVEFVKSLLCPQCKEPLGASRLATADEERTDLASTFTFTCGCENKVCFSTSRKYNRVYEVNRRFPLACFSIGRHQTHGKKFLGNMNIPFSLHANTWANHKQQIIKVTEKVAGESMRQAAREVEDAAGTPDVTVSCDGTWQRRGFQSKNGVVTAVTVNGKNSKVVDNHSLSNHCDACKKAKKKLQGQALQDWEQDHAAKCDKNHDGSAAAMEPSGAETIFRRSEEKYGLRYVHFLGDGDSKTFSSLKNADPPVYQDIVLDKLECCGHVQKRMGRQLTNKVTEMKSRTFVHNGKRVKGIGGKGGLTKKAILNIQGHFGAAIRKNKGNVQNMKRDIWAIWHHRNKMHDSCGDWCPSKSGRGDPNKNALPPYVCAAIRPVFETLTSDALLSKCAHGGTQNTNESFHNLIWQRCPKTGFVGRKRLRLAVADATIVFNDGEAGRTKVLTELGLPVGIHTKASFKDLDKKRISKAQLQATEAAQAARRQRALGAAAQDVNREDYYLPGGHE